MTLWDPVNVPRRSKKLDNQSKIGNKKNPQQPLVLTVSLQEISVIIPLNNEGTLTFTIFLAHRSQSWQPLTRSLSHFPLALIPFPTIESFTISSICD